MKSLRSRLLAGLLLGTTFCTLAAAVMLYRLADHEADERSDMYLRQTVWTLAIQLGGPMHMLQETDDDYVVQSQVWGSNGLLVYRSSPTLELMRSPRTGYSTVTAGRERWRVYAEQRDGYFVQAAQPVAVRDRIAAHMALRISPPLLLLLPALATLIWFVVGRGLRPLERVARAVHDRSPCALLPLDATGLPLELLPIVIALNSLLMQIDGAMSAQRTFVADAAHELRSPLTALKLQLQLAERAGSEALREDAFRKLHARLDRATHLVEQLLTLARHEQVSVKPPRTQYNLLQLAREAVADHAVYAESKGIDLGVSTDSQNSLAPIHVEGMQVMLGNLVDNALRYTQDGGRVDVTAGVAQGKPYLRVSDNGPGVPLHERARLFDRFYRPDGNVVWGCGLGMSIVKSVTDEHGAEVVLADNPEAGGTGLAVTVLLPVTTA